MTVQGSRQSVSGSRHAGECPILTTKCWHQSCKAKIDLMVVCFASPMPLLFDARLVNGRSIKCQTKAHGPASDRDRARGLNLLTADSTPNSITFFSNKDHKPLISYFVCCVEAVERMARESGVFILFDLRLRRGHDSNYIGNDNDNKLAARHGWYRNR
jgi:hypothetical protein